MPYPVNRDALQKACDDFNKLVPIGARIRVCKGVKGHSPWLVRTVEEPGAFVMGGHTAVVKIPGDSIALSHVEILEG
jgi:hypothetical protein